MPGSHPHPVTRMSAGGASVYPSDFKARLRAGRLCLGTNLFTREPYVAAAIYNIKPDWVWISMRSTRPGARNR